MTGIADSDLMPAVAPSGVSGLLSSPVRARSLGRSAYRGWDLVVVGVDEQTGRPVFPTGQGVVLGRVMLGREVGHHTIDVARVRPPVNGDPAVYGITRTIVGADESVGAAVLEIIRVVGAVVFHTAGMEQFVDHD